jgi:hypothetical protein
MFFSYQIHIPPPSPPAGQRLGECSIRKKIMLLYSNFLPSLKFLSVPKRHTSRALLDTGIYRLLYNDFDLLHIILKN